MNVVEFSGSPPASGATLRFRLHAPSRDLAAEVVLRTASGTWISVVDASGQQVTGVGPTARGAVVASLSWLGSRVASELLADLRLLEVSRWVREVAV
jgi:hypothetical protein